jgi:hypothetical protein
MGYIAQAFAKRARTPDETLDAQVSNLQRRLSSVGVEPPETKPSFLNRLLTDYLQRPQRAVTGLLKEVAQPGEKFEPLQELKKGLTGESKVSGKELMQVLGVSDKPFLDTQLNVGNFSMPLSFSPSGVAGFLSETVLDPLTYLTAGAGGALKGGLQLSTKGRSLLPLPFLSRLAKLPDAALTLPGTAKAGQAIDKALDLTNNLAKFKQGFTQATRGFAPAGQTIRIVKEGMEAMPAKTTKTIVPNLLDALKPPAVSGLPDAQTVDTVEQGLRSLFQTLPKAVDPAAARGFKPQMVTEALSAASGDTPLQLDAIAEVLGTTPSALVKTAEKATKAGLSEDSFVRTLTKVLKPTESIPDGMKLRSVTERARQAIPDEVTEFSAPLEGAELLGYKVGSNSLVKALGEGFKPFFGLHEKAADAARGVKRELAQREEKILNWAKNIVQITPSEVDRIAITKWLDDPARNALPRHLERIGNLIKQRFENIGRTEQEAGLLGEMWDTYVTHIYKDDPAVINKALNKWAKMQQKPMSTALGFAKERALPTLEAAKQLGLTPEYDIAKILAVRELASARAMSGVNFINEIKKLPYLVAKEGVAPTDFLKAPGIKGLEGMMVAPDVHRFLNKMNKVFGDNEAMNALTRGWDKFTNLWKSYATVTNPGFSFRNMFGNFFNNWLGDVDAQMYSLAKKVMDNGDGMIGKYTYQQVRNFAKQQGITQGFYGIELRKLLNEGVDSLTKTPNRLNPLTPDFAPIAAGRKLGEAIEQNARMAHFIDRLAKGESVEAAAESVRKHLFDYGDLTQFEKEAVRRVVPFYCLSETAEALTRRGWKNHKELEVGEDVLTLNVKTGITEWKPIRALFAAPYNGKMMHLKGKGIDTLCTPDHKWIVTRVDKEVDSQLQETWRLRTDHAIITGGPFADQDDYPIEDDVLWLIGWLSTDGHVRQRSPNHWEYVIYQSPKKYTDEIRAALSKYGSREYVHPRTGVIQFSINGELRKTLQRHYKQKGDLVSLVTKLSLRQLAILDDAMFKAEGHEHNQGSSRFRQFAQENPEIRDAYQILCYMRGIIANHSDRGMYLRSRPPRLKVSALSITVEDYQGVVWCPNTENETWVARDNGKVFATGNTWSRKNIPLQLETLLTKPGKYAQVGKVQNAIEQAAGGKDLEEQPRWVRESGATVTPISDENGRLILSPRMPYEDLAKLAPSDLLSNLMSVLHPLPKMGFELAANYNAFQRRKIEEFEGQKVPFGTGSLPAKGAYVARQVPFLQNIERLLQEDRSDRRVLDLLSTLAGVKFYNEKDTKASAKYEQRKQLEDLVALLKQEGVAVPTIADLEKALGGKKSIAQILSGAKKRAGS